MKVRAWIAALCGLFIALFAISFKASAQSHAAGAPPASIPTFSTEDVGRTGFFYVGGKYVGDQGKEVMDGAEYVEVMVPKNIRHPYPIVFFHGAGQTGTLTMPSKVDTVTSPATNAPSPPIRAAST